MMGRYLKSATLNSDVTEELKDDLMSLLDDYLQSLLVKQDALEV